MSESSVRIEFNGKPLDVPKGATIAELLEAAGIRSKLVAVEVNMDIVPREEHDSFTVSSGDCIEAVTLVGGG